MGRIGQPGARHRLVAVGIGVTLAAGALGLAGAAGTAGAASRTQRPSIKMGGTVKYAESPSAPPNYIFPETTTANQSLYNNSQFINLMWPLLYLPLPDQPNNDYARSIGDEPVWSDNDTVATVQLKHYSWSDGQPVTARDCIFYINIAKAMGATWGNYAGPTQFPYNLKSVTAVNAEELKFVLKAPVNPLYYDLNGIGYITPMPQHAWDKTSDNGAVGNYDMTSSGAKAVLAYLQKAASDQSTYATNPLWQVIDGPFKLQSFGGASSPTVFVPNPSFSGQKPYISKFEEIPFTSSSAEFTSLKSGTGTLTYGYVPSEDIPAIPSVASAGFNVAAVHRWGFDYIIPNLANPQVGPMLSQLYIRQVLQHLTDQQGMITHFMHGQGTPIYGPVPVYPAGNPFIAGTSTQNPYPFSIATAESILKKNGWTVTPGGTDYCSNAKGCGKGVPQDTQLSLNMIYSSGSTLAQEDTDLFVSDAALAGVKINATQEDFNTVIAQVQACVKKDYGTPTCNWQLGEYGGLSQSTFPSLAGVFNTGGGFNAGSYSNPTLDKLINESTVAPTLAPYHQSVSIVEQQLPFLWQPLPDAHAAIASNLAGYGIKSEFDDYDGYIEPQYWYFTS